MPLARILRLPHPHERRALRGAQLAGRPEPAFAARGRADQRRRVRRRLVRRARHPGRVPQHRTGLERPEPARARRPHQLAAVLHPHPRGDRQRRAADQLPPLPPRPLAVHAQRLHQRVRHDQARPDPRRRPVAVSARSRARPTPRCCSSSRSPSAWRTTRRPPSSRRSGSSKRSPSRHGVPHPFQGTIATTDGESIWAFRYSSERNSRSLFYTTDVPTLRKLLPRPRSLPGVLRRRAADRLRTARRRRRRLERGARVHLWRRRPNDDELLPFQPKPPATPWRCRPNAGAEPSTAVLEEREDRLVECLGAIRAGLVPCAVDQ